MKTRIANRSKQLLLKIIYALKYYKFLFVFHLVTACASDNMSKEQIESAIIDLAKKRSLAVVNSDTATLSSILGKNFRYINIYGEYLTRIKYLESNSSLNSHSSKWISQDIDSIAVQILDNSAVITFKVLDKFIFEGLPYENYCRSTFVYEKQKGEWRCIIGHTTKIE